MEDFVLLSIHDLQLPETLGRVNKKDVMAYVFLDDKCLDTLILGSSAQTQNTKDNKNRSNNQQSAGQQDSQQSSHLNVQTSSQIRAQKVRISLFDTRKKLQIILKKIGSDDKNRFGSISISLKKLTQGVGNSYMHWITLFDDLDDDIYDGQLGEDDYEQPRILLEYTVVGGQYTSVMNNMEKLKTNLDQKQIDQHQQKVKQAQKTIYHDEEAGGGAVDDNDDYQQMADEETNEYTIQVQNRRGQRTANRQSSQQQPLEPLPQNSSTTPKDFTLTVEYVESRVDKLKGRSQFKGTIINDGLNPLQSKYIQQDLDKIKRQEAEKDQEISKLMQLCEKFDIKRAKKKIEESIAKTLDDLEIQSVECGDKESVLVKFVDKLIADHQKALGIEATDVYVLSLDNYRNHLKDLEQRDISTLKRQLTEMKSIKEDLSRDLDEEETNEQSLLQQKEDLSDQVDPRIVELRKMCLLLIQELEEIKQDYRDMENGKRRGGSGNDYQDTADEEEESINQDEDDYEQGSSQNQSQVSNPKNDGKFLTYLTREEKKLIAQEMFKGHDKLFEQHMSTINDMFLQSKTLQKEREQMLLEIANLSQMLRDTQLTNIRMMENIDEQVDNIFEMRQHIEYLRKDLVSTRKRQLTYLSQLFDLYKSKDAEIERLQMSLYMSVKEKEILEQRRDAAFNELLELLVERRRVLSVVQDYTGMMGMQYDSKAQANQTRMEAHEMAEESIKVWSTKLNIVKSVMDPREKREQEYKLQQMIKELEIKQKQLLKLIQNRDQTDAKKKLLIKRYEVQGKLGESLELLILLTKEAKEDSQEMRYKIKETQLEMDSIDKLVRQQESQIQKHRREYTQTEDKLVRVNKEWNKVDPKKQNELRKTPEQVVDDEIIKARSLMAQKDEKLKNALSILNEMENEGNDNYEEIELLLSKEVQRAGLGLNIYKKVAADVYRFLTQSESEGTIQRLVRLNASKYGSLEVSHMVGQSMKNFTFVEFLRNMNY
eukprot:403332919